jgi:hypothetical protein
MSKLNTENGFEKTNKQRAVMELLNAAAMAEGEVRSKGKPFSSS